MDNKNDSEMLCIREYDFFIIDYLCLFYYLCYK